ncbi:MAG TPA: glutamate formimidoyltransferase [Bacteroidales bacterium]|nr:glutamate formimidoyltransferase [Bacteroidales bacterium]
MTRIIECVPNFSEGRNMAIIDQIVAAITSVEKVKLLNIDPGKATNRTVVTFAGDPDDVVEAAFCGAKKASEVIDMSKHMGEHPRFGATDVLPLIPIAGITMDEAVEYARKLAKRIGEELEIPVYCYGNAAFSAPRRELAYCRSGEYEGLQSKLAKPEWKPDFGPARMNIRSGAMAVGARDFLIAYNVNLNTTSTRRANAIAFDVREKGRPKREGDSMTGKIVTDEHGNQVFIPGTLKSVRAIGWYNEEIGVAQISMNLTNINITPLHIAFDEVSRKAEARGVRATGSEIVGLVPLNSMLEAGRYFLRKQNRSIGVSDDELIKIAVKSMGLDELYKFKPEEKIIEYVLEGDTGKKLVSMDLKRFANETASESPAPGGGSVSAYMATLGIALGTMVANLSSHKAGWDERWEEFSNWADKGMQLHKRLIRLVDEDTEAFNRIMEAFALGKATDMEKQIRTAAIEVATKRAMEVPFQVMETALEAMQVVKAMAETGNPNSVSDAGVGALALRSGILGAWLNVKINAGGLKDEAFKKDIIAKGETIAAKAVLLETEILKVVEGKIKR